LAFALDLVEGNPDDLNGTKTVPGPTRKGWLTGGHCRDGTGLSNDPDTADGEIGRSMRRRYAISVVSPSRATTHLRSLDGPRCAAHTVVVASSTGGRVSLSIADVDRTTAACIREQLCDAKDDMTCNQMLLHSNRVGR
jgi:hypothetical protein